ncbi:MAG: hypothetical protein GY744_04475 [Gammaproteobacteria bacterium]|nr:hypothetical protein [Gammaproteobacteria bacterium]
MLLNINIEDRNYPVNVPDEMLSEAAEFFNTVDSDMDKGWQMSRSWVDNPDVEQRCQIVADKILGAFELGNKKLIFLLSAYILAKQPGVKTVYVSTNGEMQETVFES